MHSFSPLKQNHKCSGRKRKCDEPEQRADTISAEYFSKTGCKVALKRKLRSCDTIHRKFGIGSWFKKIQPVVIKINCKCIAVGLCPIVNARGKPRNHLIVIQHRQDKKYQQRKQQLILRSYFHLLLKVNGSVSNKLRTRFHLVKDAADVFTQ